LSINDAAEHYEWEEVIIDEVGQDEWVGMTRSLCFGMGCGLLGLGALRWRRRGGGFGGNGWKGGNSSSSSSSSSGGYAFDPPPGVSGPASRFGLVVDASLSAILALGASLLAIESDAFYPNPTSTSTSTTEVVPPPQWISSIVPLVPGRSVISDTLCGPLTDEFRKFPRETWRDGHMALYANAGWRGTKYYREQRHQRRPRRVGGEREDEYDHAATAEGRAEDDSPNNNDDRYDDVGMYERLVLDSLYGFVINCERRSRHEGRIRRLRGLDRHRAAPPVVIPDDGVFADEDMELDDIYRVDDDDGDGNVNDEGGGEWGTKY
jgi:hypothetical protein